MQEEFLQFLKYRVNKVDHFDPGKDSAVAFILTWEDEDFKFLLMRRSSRDSDPWSGHLSFPGGRGEKRETVAECALRECQEEIGWAPKKEHLKIIFPSQSTYLSEMRVFCLLFVVPELPSLSDLTLEKAEVSEVYTLSSQLLFDKSAHCFYDYRGTDRHYRFPAIDFGDPPLWGLTYRMIATFLGHYGDWFPHKEGAELWMTSSTPEKEES